MKAEQRVKKLFEQALKRYALIEDGDRVLVGLSGGKDSMSLLELLALRSRVFKPRFEVEAALWGCAIFLIKTMRIICAVLPNR